ncbi:C4 protein [Tobacco leaf curl Comoros virus]|uniref:C4 protein n=1 Tax=Tobacco leaf curl Comoros virus TaxID=439423 RepID=A7DXJ0_9GEMI|nr:C4 protein [Tobacco leaf curl Comoros virus]CAM91909.1 C4 protein [Tobacco leaf curl Comoros virus]CAM91918.1 C4 protein [Tobacco leaf curl Comoros virus]
MGNLICMPLFNSRENSRAPTIASSIAYTQAVAPVSTPTYKELSPAPTSSPIWTKTETPSNGESFRSMDDLQGGDNNRPTTLTPQLLTQAVSQRLLESLRN